MTAVRVPYTRLTIGIVGFELPAAKLRISPLKSVDYPFLPVSPSLSSPILAPTQLSRRTHPKERGRPWVLRGSVRGYHTFNSQQHLGKDRGEEPLEDHPSIPSSPLKHHNILYYHNVIIQQIYRIAFLHPLG